MGIAVCSQTGENSSVHDFHGWRASAGVAHVGLRVMYHHCIRVLNQLHLMRIYVNAVGQQGLFPKDIAVHQTIHDSLAVLLKAVVQILDSLRHMDVVSHLSRLVGCCQLHGLIRDGELGVHPHHSRNHVRIVCQGMFDPGSVLHNSRPCLIHTVPVGYLIAETGSDAHLLCGVLNGKQGILYLPKACVVVKYSGDSVLNGIQVSGPGALAGLLTRQMAVNGPPHAVQDIQKTLWIITFNRKTSCHGTVDVLVGVDEGRHDDAPLCVHIFGIMELFLNLFQCAHLLYCGTVHCHCPIFKKWLFWVSGNQTTVPNH